MDTKRLRMKLSCLLLFSAAISLLSVANAQMRLTIDKALDIAEEHNPDLKASKLSLERYQQNLVAQRASLKSKFSLDLNPLNYSKTRRFDNRLSQWYTNEAFNTSGTFRVAQPILWTDGEISLINTFGWQDNKSKIGRAHV